MVLKSVGVPEEFIKAQTEIILSDPKVGFITLKLEDLVNALELLKGVSVREFNDKLLISVAKRKGLQVYTYDKNLKRECKSLGIKLL